MNSNILNGGLVIRFRRKDFFSDFEKLWFLNADDENIYFSDGSQNNYLCRINENDPEGSVILKKPCGNLILSGDWLYYINELDYKIYRCLRSGRSESRIINEPAAEFIIYGKDEILYAPVSGGVKGFGANLSADVKPARLCTAGKKLFFADKANNNYLTSIDLNSASGYRENRMTDIVPAYINSSGNNIYFSNAQDKNNIYKMDTENDSLIKICGESAEYLHIVEDTLYFWNGNVWKQVSLEGGNSKEVG
ncbi:MAG: DUF5050 domain-containing protein [Clostridiales bacterium]|jgi:hypothetical protein|nr:DUF5050 domain-containing protein [Clostridiales bacterium]